MFTGRIGIGQYWGAYFLLLLIVIALSLAGSLTLFKALSYLSISNLPRMLVYLQGVQIFIAVIALAFGAGLQVRRLHDIGLTGWIVAAFYVAGGLVYQFGRVGVGIHMTYQPWALGIVGLSSLFWIAISFWPGHLVANTFGEPIRYRSWGRALLGIKPKDANIVSQSATPSVASAPSVSNSELFPQQYTPPTNSAPPPQG